MTHMPAGYPPPASGVRPHRGTMILVFGILGIVCCFIFGIVAWVMGDGDLKAMDRGEMDRSGEGLTKAGKICGMVSIALVCLAVVLQIVFIILGVGISLIPSMGGSGGTP